MDNNYFKDIADRNNTPSIGLSFTVTDEGETSWSIVLAGHSVPVEDSDVHAMTLAALDQKYLQ
jgi:hypothetical protein